MEKSRIFDGRTKNSLEQLKLTIMEKLMYLLRNNPRGMAKQGKRVSKIEIWSC